MRRLPAQGFAGSGAGRRLVGSEDRPERAEVLLRHRLRRQAESPAYDATTVAQIAERAGLTKSTFFRHFADKRELLIAGQETLSRLLAEGITEAPPEASPLEAVAAGLERASSEMGPANRELGPRLKAAIAANTELQERDALKSIGLAVAMTAALLARGVPETTAQLAAELGVLAFKRGYNEWSEGDRDDGSGLAQHALAALQELRAASATLG